MIAGKNQDVARIVIADDVEVLVHRVRRAGIPGGLDALLGGQQLDELAQLAAQETPAALDVRTA